MISKGIFEEWFHRFGEYWCDSNPEMVISLFAHDVIYYESVLDEPYKDLNSVRKLWDVIPTNQKNVIFSFELLMHFENTAVVNWHVERIRIPSDIKEAIDGIFVIKLNTNGLCNYFKQWRTVKELK